MYEMKDLIQLLRYCSLIGLAAAYLAKTKKGRRPFVWFLIGFSFGIAGLFTLFFLPKLKKEEKKEPPAIEIEPSLNTKGDWYYIDASHSQQGPYCFDDLKQKNLTEQNYVWHEQFTEWKKWGDVFKA